MATKTKPNDADETKTDAERSPLLTTARRVLLAGIGAMSLAQDEIEDFVEKLVERGEIAEKDGRKLVREVMDRRKKSFEKAEDELSKRLEEILTRMKVPTKSDIDTLSEKIAALNKKIDELKKSRE